MCLSCRSSWRRLRRRSSRESSRERKISSSWERLWSLIRWVWRRREVCLSLSSDSLKPESLCVLTALCTDSSGGQWEDLYWAHPLHWEKPLWADTADQRSGKASSEWSWRTTGATGAGDQWSEEERRWAGAAFTHTGSHPVPAGNTHLEEQIRVDLSRSCWHQTHRETLHECLIISSSVTLSSDHLLKKETNVCQLWKILFNWVSCQSSSFSCISSVPVWSWWV